MDTHSGGRDNARSCDALSAMQARVMRLVEGEECDCDQQGETASGVGVCLNPRCVIALADALTVDDYETAEAI